MNIIFDSPLVEDLKSRHIVLELDTFEIDSLAEPMKTFCVLEQIPLTELNTADHYVKLHASLIEHYHLGQWQVCVDAINLLIGRWGGVLDSFYKEIKQRVGTLTQQQLAHDWTGNVKKKISDA